MRMPWHKSKSVQLELTGLESEPNVPPSIADAPPSHDPSSAWAESEVPVAGVEQRPVWAMQVAIQLLDEDTGNPRTEYPDAELDELTEDIRQHGILQPIVVHPADRQGRHLIHFGAKRLRAAQRAGLTHVPVVVRDKAADPYAQVAENQKRHGLSPLDLARFIKSRVEEGESNAAIARRLGMNLTTVAHHLALLDLPPELDRAMKSGRCTSPRTLHELSKLHDEQPECARALISGGAEITRTAVATLRATPAPATAQASIAAISAASLARVNTACTRLEQALDGLRKFESEVGNADLVALRRRLAELASRLA
jgi:ParB family chromosome partitioning protein